MRKILIMFLFFQYITYGLPIDTFDTVQVVEGSAFGEVRSSSAGPGVLGGVRTVVTKDGNPEVEIGPFTNFLRETNSVMRHSQNSGERGTSELIWDGDLLSDFNPDGLLGLDLTSDGALAFELLVRFFDNPSPFPIELRVYSGENRFSSHTIELNTYVDVARNIPNAEGLRIRFPFNDFTAQGTEGGADFSHVGAIILAFKGGEVPAVDIEVDLLTTDGVCAVEPAALSTMPASLLTSEGSRVILDSCNVCAGDNSSCADCNGVPNGTAVYDQCNVCGGDNRTCADCEGIPNGTAQIDICGVCKGDGSSCIDCNGEVDGQAVIDACGVCGGDNSSCSDCRGVPFGPSEADVCGVCGGDSMSCLDCKGVPNGPALPGTTCDTPSFGVCAIGVFSDSCECTPGNPSNETCDSLDNDCDGEIDEGQVCLLSDLACVSSIQDDPFAEIRDEGVPQSRLLKYVVRQELKSLAKTSRAGATILRRADRLQSRIERTVDILQDYNVTFSGACGCRSLSVQETLDRLERYDRQWDILMSKLIKRVQSRRSGGQCEGPLDECRRRVALRNKHYRSFKRRMRRINSTRISLIRQQPVIVNNCQ